MRSNRFILAARLMCAAMLAWMIVGSIPLIGQQPQLGSQLPNPRLLTIFPSGGKLGSSVEVIFTGTDLEEPQLLIFSHPGLKAEAIQPPAPPPDPKKKDAPPPPKPPVTKFKVNIAPNVPLGNHDVRFVNKWGVSNPRAFTVGDLNEVLEKEPNNDVPEAQRVDVNTTINGAIAAPTDVDFFVFNAKQGQRVIVSCLTTSIDSRLIAGVELYDAGGRRVAENRGYNDSDALVDISAPADGDYFVRLYEFTHLQGNQEHFYRLSITTAPWIDAVHPPMVEPGKPAQLTIYGRNLPDGKPDPAAVVDGRTLEKVSVTVNVPSDPAGLDKLNVNGQLPPTASGLDGLEYRIKNPSGTSNPFLLSYARAPVVLDNEKNDTLETAQEVPVPCEIAGRIEKRRDRDWYNFSLKKGETVGIELYSDRLGAPTDMAYQLFTAEKNQSVVEGDDNPETLNPLKFFTKSNDPTRFRLQANADTKYQLMVKSQDGDVRAGPRHYYRLSITPEKPDFRLVVLAPSDHQPDACRLPQGGSQYFTALLWRRDGFNGPVTVTADGLPGGVVFPPQTIAPGMKQATVVVTATPAAALGLAELKLKGTANIAGQPVVHEARAASITWPTAPQQNVPAISRLDRGLFLAVREPAPFNLTATLDKAELFPGDKANLTIKLTRVSVDFKTPLQVTAMDLPLANNQPTITINNNQPVTLNPGKDDGVAVVEAKANATPGTYNLVIKGAAQLPYAKDAAAKQKPNISVVLPSTPVTLTINPKTVATVTLAAANVQGKLGNPTEVVVKVARLYDYAGEFKVQLVLPPNVKGFSADEVTIPAGKDEAKLVVRIAADAPVGNRPDLIVRANAMYNGKVPTTQETKLGINVTK